MKDDQGHQQDAGVSNLSCAKGRRRAHRDSLCSIGDWHSQHAAWWKRWTYLRAVVEELSAVATLQKERLASGNISELVAQRIDLVVSLVLLLLRIAPQPGKRVEEGV